MTAEFINAIVFTKNYEEEKDPKSLHVIQNLPCDIYFVDDIVSVKVTFIDTPIIGRISEINNDCLILDCAKNFKSETVKINKNEITSIKMWDCPENVLVRKHIKGV